MAGEGEMATVGALLAENRELRKRLEALENELKWLKGLPLNHRNLLRRMATVWLYLWAIQGLATLTILAVALVVAGLSATSAPGGGVAPARVGQAAGVTIRPSATAFPVRTATRTARPSSTPRPPGSNCLSWRQVGLDDVGRELCVWGYLSSVGDNGEAYFMYFGERTGDFYALSYDWEFPEMQRRSCVVVEGEVQRLGSSPVIVVEYHDAVYHCAE